MASKSCIYQFYDVRVEPEEFRVFKNGAPLTLEPKAFQVLVFLLEERGRLISKDELLDAVWKDSFVTQNALTRVIAQLRRALGDATQNSSYIETVPTRGYRFIAEVEEIETKSAAESDSPAAIADETAAQVETAAGHRKASTFFWKRREVIIAALLLSITATLGIVYFVYSKKLKETEANSESPEQTLAVLPFKLLNPDDESNYLSVGLADSLITKLSNVRSLTVRPTGSVIRYGSNDIEAANAGRDLKVESVIDGVIQKDGDRVRVTVQLIRVADGKPIWANSYDTQFVNIFQVQDEISARITDALKVRLSAEEQTRLERPPTGNIEAFQLYLRGNDNLNSISPDHLNAAIKYFNDAIALDPNFALAYAKLANAYGIARSFNFPSAAQLAEKAALKAIELDPNLAEAHTSIAVLQFWVYRDTGKAQDSFVHSLELNPNSTYTHQYYAWFLVATAHFDEAERHLRRALELDPQSQTLKADLGLPYYYSRRYDEARKFYKQSLEADDKYWYGHMRLAEACEGMGDFDCAASEFKRAAELSPGDPALRTVLARTLALAGKKDEARQILKEITARDATPVLPYFLVLAYAGLGEPEKVFATLERALNEKDSWLCWIKVDPRLDSFRSDARFDSLLKRSKLK
ncbi:MAG TPA: winged helix-turn-helix domain-containing protein [Pyrinomonadaceae bacterium]|jgi:TolB-like protein/DNA-binding winged helix-turn-helix (wHTH) protein/Tfp pilus assembly protein PilF